MATAQHTIVNCLFHSSICGVLDLSHSDYKITFRVVYSFSDQLRFESHRKPRSEYLGGNPAGSPPVTSGYLHHTLGPPYLLVKDGSACLHMHRELKCE